MVSLYYEIQMLEKGLKASSDFTINLPGKEWAESITIHKMTQKQRDKRHCKKFEAKYDTICIPKNIEAAHRSVLISAMRLEQRPARIIEI